MAQYEITAPDGRRFRVTAPDNASQAQVMAYAQQQYSKQQRSSVMDEVAANTEKQRLQQSVIDNMGTGETLAAGVGKAFTDTWLGARQLAADVGSAAGFSKAKVWQKDLQKEAVEKQQLDEALMNTTAGQIGNFAGQAATVGATGFGAAGLAAKAAPKIASAVKGASTAGKLAAKGAVGGAIESSAGVQTGETAEERWSQRGSNALTGAAAGAIGGAVTPAVGKALLKGTQGAVNLTSDIIELPKTVRAIKDVRGIVKNVEKTSKDLDERIYNMLADPNKDSIPRIVNEHRLAARDRVISNRNEYEFGTKDYEAPYAPQAGHKFEYIDPITGRENNALVATLKKGGRRIEELPVSGPASPFKFQKPSGKDLLEERRIADWNSRRDRLIKQDQELEIAANEEIASRIRAGTYSGSADENREIFKTVAERAGLKNAPEPGFSRYADSAKDVSPVTRDIADLLAESSFHQISRLRNSREALENLSPEKKEALLKYEKFTSFKNKAKDFLVKEGVAGIGGAAAGSLVAGPLGGAIGGAAGAYVRNKVREKSKDFITTTVLSDTEQRLGLPAGFLTKKKVK